MKIHTIEKTDPRYPKEFLAIGDEAPARIYAMGNLDLLTRPHKVAVIGARKASRKGLDAAYRLGAKFGRAATVVVSGLALGCDGAAHEGCLAARGETIAIVATGLDLVHPREHADLQRRILDAGGLVLSEQPLRTKANPTRLVARNRLQAALCDKVVVAECPEHSGTMHTVRFAQTYGKPVTAVHYPAATDFNSGNSLILATLGTPEPLGNS